MEPRLRRFDLLLQPRGLDQGEQALEPARRHGLHAVNLVRACQVDFARPEPLREIVGGKADAPLRRAKAKRLAHRPAEPGARLLMPRPDAFVEAAENHEVGLLQPRFERSPDEQPRMQRRARPHHLAGNQAAIERRIVGGREREARGLRRSTRRAGRRALRRHLPATGLTTRRLHHAPVSRPPRHELPPAATRRCRRSAFRAARRVDRRRPPPPAHGRGLSTILSQPGCRRGGAAARGAASAAVHLGTARSAAATARPGRSSAASTKKLAAASEAGPWLSRPMRKTLDLSPPERHRPCRPRFRARPGGARGLSDTRAQG